MVDVSHANTFPDFVNFLWHSEQENQLSDVSGQLGKWEGVR